MDKLNIFDSIVLEHIHTALKLNKLEILDLTNDIVRTLKAGGKIVFFGNGGSATQASHWAEEFVVRFVKKRRSLPSIALGTNFANLTGTGNDFGFEEIFAREIESLADKKDLVIGISTSGNSPNVIKGLEKAKQKKIKTWILTGNGPNKAMEVADKTVSIDSNKTARIQEMHSLIIHIVFEHLEYKKF